MRVNGITDLVVTKLDVMSGMEKVPICVAYDVDGVRYDDIPMTQTAFHHAKPIYEELDGWWEDISKVPRRSRSCRSTPSATSSASRNSAAPGSASSASAPGREENIIRHELI